MKFKKIIINRLLLAIICLPNIFFISNAVASCSISSSVLQAGDTVICEDMITDEYYTITKTNITFINNADWSYAGNLADSYSTALIGLSTYSNLYPASDLVIINNGKISWIEASLFNSVNGYKYLVGLGSYIRNYNSNAQITNNGVINITTNPNVYSALASVIAYTVTSGNIILTNNGSITITAYNSGYTVGMVATAGTDVVINNSSNATIDVIYTGDATTDSSAGINYYSSSSVATNTVTIKNEGKISVTSLVGYGIEFDSSTKADSSLTSVVIENTGTINVDSSSSESAAIFVYKSNTVNTPIAIKNNGTLTAYNGLLVSSDSTSNIEFYNSGDVKGNVITAAGDDYIEQSAGTITGDIYTYAGNDTLIISGGTVTANIVDLGEGNDTFTFSGGRLIGTLTMGDGDDTATVYGGADLSGTLQLDGGAGTDNLTFNGVTLNAYTDDSSNPNNDLAKGVNLSTWEEINLVSSSLTLTGDLLSESNVGELNIDSYSYLYTDIVSATIYGDVNNSGNIDLSNNNSVGDTLTIDGNYVGNGGYLVLSTILGDDNSTTDKLVITGDASGTTYVAVKNLGGSGAATVEGIQIVEVIGTSTSDAFSKSGRIVAGSYEYDVVQGNTSGTDTNSWYLTSKYIDDGGTKTDTSVIRPEAGAYIANLASANTLFNTTLHDRLGETQYTDLLTGEKLVTSMWIRSVVGQNRFVAGHGQLKNKMNWSLVQLGGDIAQWSSNDTNRLHLGVMAGYGRSSSDTDARLSGYSAKGSIDGYSLGLYGTWYDNDADKTGLYIDSWVLWNHFNAKVHGQELAREKYKLKGITASIESGYTFKLGGSELYNYWLQPKAQVTYMGVDADSHTESNGTKVKGDTNNWQSRLGVRLSANTNDLFNSKHSSAGQLFIEANWLHNSEPFSVKMDNSRISQEGARNIAEIKTGVEANILTNTHVWFNLNYQPEYHDYRNLGAMLGVKYSFQ